VSEKDKKTRSEQVLDVFSNKKALKTDCHQEPVVIYVPRRCVNSPRHDQLTTTEPMASILPKEIFDYFAYDPETGVMRWKRDNGRCNPKGKLIGHKNKKGRIEARFKGKSYLCHRIAWAIGHNTLDVPPILDHINGNPSDNRLCNLRAATSQQNMFNTKSRRKGLKGASFRKRSNKWISQIRFCGKQKHLGYFDTEIEAHEAYCRAAQKFHGEFFNPG
jgi:hypothetical protein